jgi:hypothetical protein
LATIVERSIKELAAAADKFKESCSAGTSAPMIVQVPAPSKGNNYSRGEVDGVYAKAKKTMREKGLIPGEESLLLVDPAGNWIEIVERRIVP